MLNYKIMTIPGLILISLACSDILFAGGRREETVDLEPICIEELDLSEIRTYSLDYFNVLNGYFPKKLDIFIELKDEEDNTLMEQRGIIDQIMDNDTITQEISLVIPESREMPGMEEGRPKSGSGQGRSSSGGSGGMSGGPSSGKGGGNGGPPGDEKPEGEFPGQKNMTEEEIEKAEMHLQGGAEFWKISRKLISGIENGSVTEIPTDETLYIFDFPCVGYDLFDVENNVLGRSWIDSEKGLPIKIALEGKSEQNYSLDIYLLPSNEMKVRISSIYFSRRMQDENENILVLSGTLTPAEWDRL